MDQFTTTSQLASFRATGSLGQPTSDLPTAPLRGVKATSGPEQQPVRTTGFRTNRRPVLSYHAKLDDDDNPALQQHCDTSKTFCTQTKCDYTGGQAPVADVPVRVPKTASGFASNQSVVKGSVESAAEKYATSAALSYNTKPLQPTTLASSQGLARERLSGVRANQQQWNPISGVASHQTTHQAGTMSEQQASFSQREGVKLPPVGGSAYTYSTRHRPFFYPPSSREIYGEGSNTAQDFSSTSSRAFPDHTSTVRRAPPSQSTVAKNASAFQQNVNTYKASQADPSVYSTSYSQTVADSKNWQRAASEEVAARRQDNNYSRMVRTHQFKVAQETDKALLQQSAAVQKKQLQKNPFLVDSTHSHKQRL
eukprot:m.124304 g.124304  ORF g.124304 m.124304 type:complete len:367 (-) comp19738_c0_seq2:32-1132(-)